MDAEMLYGIFAFILLISSEHTQAIILDDCMGALGLQSGDILDSALSSSSHYDERLGAQNARIRTDREGGAWCPKHKIGKNSYEYVQVELGRLMVITNVETQGRFGNGQGQEFTEFFRLEYQREPNGFWFKFRNRKGEEKFDGNENTYNSELRPVDPFIIARTIRFIPVSDHDKTVCMRVELYGCDWQDGTIEYAMRQGERRGSEINLLDFTYDGRINGSTQLSGGLGQLTDGVVGQSNFRLDPRDYGIKGYDWVGWKNDTLQGLPVVLLFRFDVVRNFSSIRLHCNNLYSKDVRVFRRATVSFSVGGEIYSKDVISFKFMRDALIEFARIVIIPLRQRVGRFVRLELYHDDRWLMLSEVQFVSHPADGNFTPEVGSMLSLENGETNSTGGSEKRLPSDNDEMIGIVIGVLATLIFLLFVLMVVLIVRQRRGKLYSKQPPTSTASVTLNDLSSLPTVPAPLSLHAPPIQNGKLCNGKMYSYVASSDVESDREGTLCRLGGVFSDIQHRRLPELPRTPESTDTNNSREYAVPEIGKSSVIVNIPPPPPPPRRPDAAAIQLSPNIAPQAAVDSSTLPAVASDQGMWSQDLSVMEFPRENLAFIEKLGEGQFGEVHLCEAQNMSDFLGDDFLLNRASGNSFKVVVKLLRAGTDAGARYDFEREAQIMCRLKDPNIVRVLGVCTRSDPMCVIVEFMPLGDMHEFLKQRIPDTTPGTLHRRKSSRTLSHGCLIYMASQIASGMKYLEGLSIVHRDLAARNCLVGAYFNIKISDFGMSRTLYSADYYRIEGRAMLPIRWMSWESILLGKFSSKSDVWSFGVALWELMSFARHQPYDGLNDEQVIGNANRFYTGEMADVVALGQPQHCPREIYDLMKECWNRLDRDRPTFKEIHMFLMRKNIGFDPKLEQRTTLTRDLGHRLPMV